MAVIADTSGLYALLDADDRNHVRAAAAWLRLTESQLPILVHDYVLMETWSLMQARLGLAAVTVLHRDYLPLMDVVPVVKDVLLRGMARCLGSSRRDLSLVDCVSFEIASDARITRAFAFDAHYTDAGLRLPEDSHWPM